MPTDTETSLERALKNPELMKRANRGSYTTLTDTEDNRLCFIAATTMMVLERGWVIERETVEVFRVFKWVAWNEGRHKTIATSPDLLTALLDALEAEDE